MGKLNEAQIALAAIKEMIAQRIAECKKGIKLPTGEKVSYKELQENFENIESYINMNNMEYYGICKDCKHYNPKGYKSGHFGKCEYHKIAVHCYGSCYRCTKSRYSDECVPFN